MRGAHGLIYIRLQAISVPNTVTFSPVDVFASRPVRVPCKYCRRVSVCSGCDALSPPLKRLAADGDCG